MKALIMILITTLSSTFLLSQTLEQGWFESDKSFTWRIVNEVGIVDFTDEHMRYRDDRYYYPKSEHDKKYRILYLEVGYVPNYTKIKGDVIRDILEDHSINVVFKLIDAQTGSEIKDGIMKHYSDDFIQNYSSFVSGIQILSYKIIFSKREFEYYKKKKLILKLYTYTTPNKKYMERTYYSIPKLIEMEEIIRINPLQDKIEL